MNTTPPLFLLFALAAPIASQTFTVVGLPDTQRYSELYPAIYQSQTQWIAAQAAARSIRYVSHYGDVVQHGDSLAEWHNADVAMATLDAAGIPYGVTAGNHDITPSGIAGSSYIPANFRTYFGAQRFAGKPWYRGDSPSGMSSYQLFDAHGVQFLALHVECDTALRELEWAQGILHENRDKPVLLTTHRYLQDAQDYTGGVPLVASGRYPDVWYSVEGLYTPDGIRSERLWDWFVRRNPNILLVQCGHFHEEFRQTSTNAYGNPVHEVLADYQDDPNGGNGFLRVMTFDLGNDRIDVQSYSPWLDQFYVAAESQFSLPVDFDRYRSLEPTVVLQQGVAGYQGCQDTWLNQDAPNATNGNAATIVVDDVDAPSRPDFLLHRVLVDWNEASTWNSLGGGLQVGSELDPNAIVIPGDNNRDGDGLRHLDVTGIVQAWSNGAPNYGFAILPEIIPLKDDGIEIAASEHGNALLRPRLEVTYASSCGFQRTGVGVGQANTLELVGLGLPRIGRTMEVTTTNGPDAATVTALATGSAAVPLFGGMLWIDPAQLLVLTVGSPDLVIAVPDLPQFVGVDFHFQSLAFDPAMPEGFALSNGLTATLCR